MTKYHLSKKGEAERCRAIKRACPLGGADDHVEAETLKEARVWAEQKIATDYEPYSGVKRSEGNILRREGIETYQVASEHKEYKGKFYGYVTLKVAGEAEPIHIPQDLKGNLVNDVKIWEFIDSIPQDVVNNEAVKKVIKDSHGRIRSWTSTQGRTSPSEEKFIKLDQKHPELEQDEIALRAVNETMGTNFSSIAHATQALKTSSLSPQERKAAAEVLWLSGDSSTQVYQERVHQLDWKPKTTS